MPLFVNLSSVIIVYIIAIGGERTAGQHTGVSPPPLSCPTKPSIQDQLVVLPPQDRPRITHHTQPYFDYALGDGSLSAYKEETAENLTICERE